MKYLRMTMWLGRRANPMTTIIPEDSLTIPIYYAANRHRELSAAMMGPPVEVEIHEYPDNLSMQEVSTRVATERREPLSDKANAQNTLFDWAMVMLDQLNPGGVLQTTLAAPLDVDDLCVTLRYIANSPSYRGQTINMTAKDQTLVSLVKGVVGSRIPS